MLILETMAALTREELVALICEAREEAIEPAYLYDDNDEIIQEALAEHMADVFIKMQRLIDAARRRGNTGKEDPSGCDG